jgi:HPr kinase/phosphorylase
MSILDVSRLFERHADYLKLSWIAGQTGGQRKIHLVIEEHHPACAAIGYLNLIHSYQIQIIGQQELRYLDSLAPPLYRDALRQIFEKNQPACIIVTDNLRPAEDFQQQADQTAIPLLASPLPGQSVMSHLHEFFVQLMSQRVTLHGVFMDVLGTGVLIMGDSGTGKSELALELISRGHRLVADDAPEFTKLTPTIVNGTCPLNLTSFLEVRGLGILNVQTLFGDSAVKSAKYLRLIVHLVPVSAEQLQNMDRLHGDYRCRKVLGVDIPEIRLPVAPGRNLAVLLECAVRNHKLKMQGYDAAADFIARHQRILEQGQF